MTMQDLYDEIAEARKYLCLPFHQMDKVSVFLSEEGYVRFEYNGHSVNFPLSKKKTTPKTTYHEKNDSTILKTQARGKAIQEALWMFEKECPEKTAYIEMRTHEIYNTMLGVW